MKSKILGDEEIETLIQACKDWAERMNERHREKMKNEITTCEHSGIRFDRNGKIVHD